MKSLAAWSSDRETDRSMQNARTAASQSMMDELSELLDAVVGKLIETASLYEAIHAHQRQKGAIRSWVNEQGRMLTTALAEQTEKIRLNLSHALAGAILPVLSDVIEKKAIDDFCGVVEEVTQKALEKDMAISVPARLHEALVAELQRRGLEAKLESSTSDELVLLAGDTRVETSIRQFNERLQEAVAA